jgi:electron transfer DM13
MSTRRTLVVAVALAVVVGGTAAGLVLSGGTARAQGPPGVLRQGPFRAVGWGTEGSASVVRERSGDLVLRFDKSFHTNRAPDLWVYIGAYQGLHGVGNWTLVGRLYRWYGRHTYPLKRVPAKGSSVIIYCGKCDRAFGAALLRVT